LYLSLFIRPVEAGAISAMGEQYRQVAMLDVRAVERMCHYCYYLCFGLFIRTLEAGAISAKEQYRQVRMLDVCAVERMCHALHFSLFVRSLKARGTSAMEEQYRQVMQRTSVCAPPVAHAHTTHVPSVILAKGV
jgi:hypothetical protein